MSRLESVLDVDQRASLIRSLCERSLEAARHADLSVLVVTSADEVCSWAERLDVDQIDDPGLGLSAAAGSAVASLNGAPWLVLHPDLPLVGAATLGMVVHTMADEPVLVPSQDGGTNVVASSGPFPFAYGPGSFHRHLSSAPHATVLALSELSIEIDTPAHLAAIDAAGLRPGRIA